MHLVSAPLDATDATLPVVSLRVERRRLARTLWRTVAEDGAEFGFELARPLAPGDFVHQTDRARYRIEQEPEACLEIEGAPALDPAAALHLGWSIGNLHLPIDGSRGRILVPDEVVVHRLLAKLGVPYRRVVEVFLPGASQGHGHGHAHSHPHSHDHGH